MNFFSCRWRQGCTQKKVVNANAYSRLHVMFSGVVEHKQCAMRNHKTTRLSRERERRATTKTISSRCFGPEYRWSQLFDYHELTNHIHSIHDKPYNFVINSTPRDDVHATMEWCRSRNASRTRYADGEEDLIRTRRKKKDSLPLNLFNFVFAPKKRVKDVSIFVDRRYHFIQHNSSVSGFVCVHIAWKNVFFFYGFCVFFSSRFCFRDELQVHFEWMEKDSLSSIWWLLFRGIGFDGLRILQHTNAVCEKCGGEGCEPMKDAWKRRGRISRLSISWLGIRRQNYRFLKIFRLV